MMLRFGISERYQMSRPFVLLASIYGFLGVALGAFAAHGLRHSLPAEVLGIFQTGVQYQLIHALALLGVGILTLRWPSRWLFAAGALFTLGILLFSGSLYLLTLTGWRVGMVTPIGGVCLLSGWLCMGVAAWKAR